MASKRHQRRRKCTDKVAHAEKGQADAHARRLGVTYQGQAWAVYRCEFCGCWHVGRKRSMRPDTATR